MESSFDLSYSLELAVKMAENYVGASHLWAVTAEVTNCCLLYTVSAGSGGTDTSVAGLPKV